jgi:hypothetical protein
MVRLPDQDAIGSARLIRGLRDLWAETTGDPRVTNAILDGPVDRTHPALVGADLTTVEVTVAAAPRPGDAAWHSGGEPGLRPARIAKSGRGDRSRLPGDCLACFQRRRRARPDRGRPALGAGVLAARSGPGDPAGGGAWGSSDQHQWRPGCVVRNGPSHLGRRGEPVHSPGHPGRGRGGQRRLRMRSFPRGGARRAGQRR